jgi:type I restriction enzyme S subunit
MTDQLLNISEGIASKIDKSNWKKFTFSQIAENIVEKIAPKDSALEHYIGLEHLDSGSIRIKRFGDPKSLEGDKLKIYKGDVIFAKRNAYLKRAAVAEFDAVASAHSMVLRAKPDTILPNLLPFFMLSDAFWNRAIEISVGSLSPTINWKVLAKQEFLLPPKDQQARLAELLWAADEVVEQYSELALRGESFFKRQIEKLTLEGINNSLVHDERLKISIAKDWMFCAISELLKGKYILEIQDGNHGELHPKSSDYVDKGIPFIMANTLMDGELQLDKAEKLPKTLTDKLRIGFSVPGDVLLSHKGTVGQVAIVPDEIDWEYLMLTPQVTYYRLDRNKLSNKFLYYVFCSDYFQKQLRTLSSQSTRAYVGITAQQNLKIAIPRSIKEQEEIAELLSITDKSFDEVDHVVQNSKQLQKSLINQIF